MFTMAVSIFSEMTKIQPHEELLAAGKGVGSAGSAGGGCSKTAGWLKLLRFHPPNSRLADVCLAFFFSDLEHCPRYQSPPKRHLVPTLDIRIRIFLIREMMADPEWLDRFHA